MQDLTASLESFLHQQVPGEIQGRRPISDSDLAVLVEKRLPVEVIGALLRNGLQDSEVYQLIVPRRTLAHRVAKSEPLSKEESDRVVRVARISMMAEEVFGESERAWRWLRKPKRRFNGRSAMDMLGTEAGARLVEEMIVQISDGIAA